MKTRRRRIGIASLATFVLTIAACAGFFLWLLTLSGGLPSLSSTHYDVTAVLPSAGAELVPGARVTMAGVQVGEVTSVARRGSDALVGMTITNGAITPLAADSRVQPRYRTALGENYIEIIPGQSGVRMRSGGVIPIARSLQTVDVDQLLSTLHEPARTQARKMIQALGGSIGGRGDQLNTLLGGSASTIQSGADVVAALVPQRQQIGQLVQQLGDLTAGIGQQGTEIRQLADGGLTTFRAIAARDTALRTLIDVLPPTLHTIQTTTSTLRVVTGQAAPVLFNLASTLDAARPAAVRLAPAATELRGVLHDLGYAAGPLKQTLSQVVRLAPSAATALPLLHQALCQVNPMIRYTKPYIPDLIGMITELGGASNTFDSIGHTILLTAIINENSLVGQTPAVGQALQTLLHSGLLAKSNRLTYDPYPGPMQGNNLTTGSAVTGPGDLRAVTGYVYPHVVADC
jgi:phospholipid/cholesterol/gamma-HCH transport system substrate-binding protein